MNQNPASHEAQVAKPAVEYIKGASVIVEWAYKDHGITQVFRVSSRLAAKKGGVLLLPGQLPLLLLVLPSQLALDLLLVLQRIIQNLKPETDHYIYIYIYIYTQIYV